MNEIQDQLSIKCGNSKCQCDECGHFTTWNKIDICKNCGKYICSECDKYVDYDGFLCTECVSQYEKDYFASLENLKIGNSKEFLNYESKISVEFKDYLLKEDLEKKLG